MHSIVCIHSCSKYITITQSVFQHKEKKYIKHPSPPPNHKPQKHTHTHTSKLGSHYCPPLTAVEHHSGKYTQ